MSVAEWSLFIGPPGGLSSHRPIRCWPQAISGERLSRPQRVLIGWFGIRGIGSVFYLLLALRHGVSGDLADTLISLTLWTVVASIILHGLTAQPLMRRYWGLRP